jgi:hypothetical protein
MLQYIVQFHALNLPYSLVRLMEVGEFGAETARRIGICELGSPFSLWLSHFFFITFFYGEHFLLLPYYLTSTLLKKKPPGK